MFRQLKNISSNMEIIIKIADEKDASELLEIYRPYVEKTAVTFEYDVPDVKEFSQRIKNIKQKYPYIKAVLDGKIVGYAYASVFKDRSAYDWSVETSVYVKEDCKKCGIGSLLYKKLEEILSLQGFLNVNACIAYTEKQDENLTNDSVYFHKKLGYSLVGEFHKCGYKFGKWYEMVWMEKFIGKHSDKPEKIVPFKEIENNFR